MAPLDTESQFKFLISCIKHANSGKIDFAEVANELDIVSKAAAAKRYERLMKAHNISPRGALSGGGGGGSSAPNSSPTTPATPKKRAAKKRKVEVDPDDEDEIPDVKPEVKTETKTEKKVKEETKHSEDDGSFQLSDIPEAPPCYVKSQECYVKQEASFGGGNEAGSRDVPDDACHACKTEQVAKHEPAPGVLKYEYNPSPHHHNHHTSLDYGGAFSHTMMTLTAAPTQQSFGYGTNSGFQTMSPAPMPLPTRRTEPPSNGPAAAVFPGESWLQTGPRHFYWDEDSQQ